MVKNDSLITYEKAFEGQAAVKKFFIATFLERKIMSTKTTIKHIALVAASALAIAGFSAVPANAAVNAAALAFINKSTTVNVAGAGATALSTGQTGVSYTANGAITNSVASLTVPAAAVVAFKITAANAATWDAGSAARVKANGALVSELACTIATVTCTLANYTAPSTPGTYNMELIMSGDAGSFAVADVESISFTLTVSALSDFSAGRSTVYLADGAAAGTADRCTWCFRCQNRWNTSCKHKGNSSSR